MPKSLRWFVITGIVYLLTVFPVTGLFLMMVAAPSWSAVTINLGFISLVREVWRGQIGRLWLILPVAWFGGYAVFTVASHQAVRGLDADIARQNEGLKLAFDPRTKALVFGHEAPFYRAAEQSLLDYDLPVAFESNTNGKAQAYRIGGLKACAWLRRNRTNQLGSGVFTIRELTNGFCQYRASENPEQPTVSLSISGGVEKHKRFLLTYELYHVEIVDSGGASITLLAGRASPYMWVPLPVMGCALSGNPSWECIHGFVQEPYSGLGGGEIFDVVARALGLRPHPSAARGTQIEIDSISVLERLIAKFNDR